MILEKANRISKRSKAYRAFEGILALRNGRISCPCGNEEALVLSRGKLYFNHADNCFYLVNSCSQCGKKFGFQYNMESHEYKFLPSKEVS